LAGCPVVLDSNTGIAWRWRERERERERERDRERDGVGVFAGLETLDFHRACKASSAWIEDVL
jgi:hypothetical protein